MYGLKALQADGLVAQRQEVKPAVQMRNSVDTYYRNVLPTTKTTSPYSTYNRFRSQPLLRAKPMVELAPKRMGSTYFNTFMAVPDVGKGGVYDSPMAQDYYVKRFGFMFGGGRSG